MAKKEQYTILLVPYVTTVIAGYVDTDMKTPKILLKENFCTSFMRNAYPIYYHNSYRDVFKIIESIGETIAEVSEVPYLSSDGDALTLVNKINILSALGTDNVLASIVTYHINENNLYHSGKEEVKAGKENVSADFVRNMKKVGLDYERYRMMMQVPLFFKESTFNIYNIEGDDSRYITKKMTEKFLQKKVLNIHNRKAYNLSTDKSYDITTSKTYDLFSHIAHIIFREVHKLFFSNKIYLARTKLDEEIFVRYSSFNFVKPLAIKIWNKISGHRIRLVRL